MKTLINSARSPLGLPGKKLLDPGQNVEVSDAEFDKLTKNKVVKAWIDRGMLEVEDGEPDADDESDDDADDEKASIIAELADLGIQKSARLSIRKLRKALKDAKAKQE